MKKRQLIYGFPERLSELIYQSGLSHSEIARSVGLERKSIGVYVRGEHAPSSLTISRLSILFNVSADYLLFGKK